MIFALPQSLFGYLLAWGAHHWVLDLKYVREFHDFSKIFQGRSPGLRPTLPIPRLGTVMQESPYTGANTLHFAKHHRHHLHHHLEWCRGSSSEKTEKKVYSKNALVLANVKRKIVCSQFHGWLEQGWNANLDAKRSLSLTAKSPHFPLVFGASSQVGNMAGGIDMQVWTPVEEGERNVDLSKLA